MRFFKENKESKDLHGSRSCVKSTAASAVAFVIDKLTESFRGGTS